ncbi:gamma carbonic anhydrase family protein [Aquibium sp. LZ166]|uniref:Gamma carbonic anhydrase family protein n=1 Tax=Aquibium pacificus TaxID=3153579 RepID=A0ABV3SGZ6_9HYPH
MNEDAGMTIEQTPIILPYKGTAPVFASPPTYMGPGSAVLGRATLGRSAWLGARSVIRADGHYVTIGDDFRLGGRGTVHIAHDVLPTHIGSHVTAGRRAVIHACDVGGDCFIGDDVVVLDGSKVAEACAIAAGSIVFPRSALESGWLYEGAPAKRVRRLEAGELDALHHAARSEPDEYEAASPDSGSGPTQDVFVAANVRLRGRIECEGENGIWYGCELDAGDQAIKVGLHTNIQDNTVIRAVCGRVIIGAESTIGHNVTMTDCEVGHASLIGIGSVVAPGTIVKDDVLVAAGARTTEGQILESGWLYGGSPAKQIAPLDAKKRDMIAATWAQYCSYAAAFRKAQLRPSTP